jgi:arylsulfatase
MSTPFKWVKQVASHYGGTAQGMAMSWPGHINDVGGIRRQFHHVIDIEPTILEATRIPAPDMLDNSTLARFYTPRPNLTAGRTVFTYSGTLTGVPNSGAPNILNKSYIITAEVEIPEGGAEGMIVTDGGRFGGYGLFLSKGEFGLERGKVVFLYNLLDLKRTTWEGPELTAGKHTIVFDYKIDAPGLGKGGTGVLYVDGQEVARNTMEHSTPITFPEDETFDIGADTRTGVALLEYRYDVPFKFTGKLNKLTFELDLTPLPEATRQ